jgi:hypothetical protein
MADLIFVSIIVAFFALCVLYLRWCDRIIGPDEFAAERDDVDSPYVAMDATLVDTTTSTEVTA